MWTMQPNDLRTDNCSEPSFSLNQRRRLFGRLSNRLEGDSIHAQQLPLTQPKKYQAYLRETALLELVPLFRLIVGDNRCRLVLDAKVLQKGR
jgi:hypothetical protein